MSRQIAFGSFSVTAPMGWIDITGEVDGAPYTIAHREGAGAMQISIALYKSGQAPSPTTAALREMVEEFGRKQGLGTPTSVTTEQSPLRLAAGSFVWSGDFLRVWHVSDGYNFAFATYTCASKPVKKEVEACEQIIRSLRFVAAQPGIQSDAAAQRGLM